MKQSMISPCADEILQSELKENTNLKDHLEELREKHFPHINYLSASQLLSIGIRGIPDNVATYGVLTSKIFSDLDELTKLGLFSEIESKRFQIVVIGDESVGKLPLTHESRVTYNSI